MKHLFFLIFLAIAGGQNAPNGYEIGSEATGFSLKNASNTINGVGVNVSLTDYNNASGFIVVFTCNHCPYSKAYEDRIIELHKNYAPKGYPVIAINPNDAERSPEDSYANMKKRAKEKGFPFAYLHDETQEIAKTYGATRTPHVFVLQKKGKKNVVRYIGAIDDNTYTPAEVKIKYVENAIDALVSGKAIDTETSKAVGCTIKWKE